MLVLQQRHGRDDPVSVAQRSHGFGRNAVPQVPYQDVFVSFEVRPTFNYLRRQRCLNLDRQPLLFGAMPGPDLLLLALAALRLAPFPQVCF